MVNRMNQTLTAEDRNWALYGNAAALLGLTGIPFANVLGPLIVYLKVRDESAFATEHARESLNFQITVSAAFLVAIFVAIFAYVVFVIGMVSKTPAGAFGGGVFFGLAMICMLSATIFKFVEIVFVVIACIAASEGRPYRYPLSIRFVR
jgi:uncharacterized Tic20 family protein